jgi:hypothetical protein
LEDWKLPEKIKRQEIERILTEQKNSLDIWIDYLSDETAQYDIWLKYWAVRSILWLQSYNKKRWNFPKRSKWSINPFPELNREALAYTFDFMLAKIQGEEIKKPNEWADEEKFKKVLNDEGFWNIYSFALQEMTKTYWNILENINWEWKKYYRWTNHIPLVESLRWKATGWCTTGEKTAKKQLNGGDFYVYYSQDKNWRNTIPRLGIRMKNGEIAEIRWIAENQNMDPYIQSVLEEKLKEFWSEWEKYKKKVSDMNKLTEIYNNPTRELSREDLVFLYEIDYEISWFWYKKDPRIWEIHQKRNFEKDLLRIFDWTIKRIEGDLDLSRLEALPEWFEFPEEIWWSLDLRELEILPKWVKLLRKIWWNLYLSRKALQEWIKLPEVWWRVVYFNSLKALQEWLNLSKFLKNEDKEIISKEIIKSSEIYF